MTETHQRVSKKQTRAASETVAQKQNGSYFYIYDIFLVLAFIIFILTFVYVWTLKDSYKYISENIEKERAGYLKSIRVLSSIGLTFFGLSLLSFLFKYSYSTETQKPALNVFLIKFLFLFLLIGTGYILMLGKNYRKHFKYMFILVWIFISIIGIFGSIIVINLVVTILYLLFNFIKNFVISFHKLRNIFGLKDSFLFALFYPIRS